MAVAMSPDHLNSTSSDDEGKAPQSKSDKDILSQPEQEMLELPSTAALHSKRVLDQSDVDRPKAKRPRSRNVSNYHCPEENENDEEIVHPRSGRGFAPSLATLNNKGGTASSYLHLASHFPDRAPSSRQSGSTSLPSSSIATDGASTSALQQLKQSTLPYHGHLSHQGPNPMFLPGISMLSLPEFNPLALMELQLQLSRAQAPALPFGSTGTTASQINPFGTSQLTSLPSYLLNQQQSIGGQQAATSLLHASGTRSLSDVLQGIQSGGASPPTNIPPRTSRNLPSKTPSSTEVSGPQHGENLKASEHTARPPPQLKQDLQLPPPSSSGMKRGERSAILYVPKDEIVLSTYQCMVRKQIELFEATDDDVQFTISKMSKPVVLGQVGIRCRHCAILPQYARPKAAVYFPRSLVRTYSYIF